MNVVIDRCGDSNTPLNTGVGKQCLYGPTVGYALATEDQKFASLAAFRSKLAWDSAKQAKDVVVMFSVESSALANVEPTYFESRTLKVKTKEARKGVTFTHHLGLCSHGALQSYEGSSYTRIYEFTADGDIKGVQNADGSVQGQSLSSFLVGDIIEPVIEGDPQSTVVDIVYKNPKELTLSGAIVTPDFDVEGYKGVYPLQVQIVGTPTATSIVARVTSGCDGVKKTGLALANFKAERENGDDQTSALSSVTVGNGDDANLYTFVTSGLVSGKLLTEVVVESLAMFEDNQGASFTI